MRGQDGEAEGMGCVCMCQVPVGCVRVPIVLHVFVISSCMNVTRIQHSGSGTVLGS